MDHRCAISAKLMESLDIFNIPLMFMAAKESLAKLKIALRQLPVWYNQDGPLSIVPYVKDNLIAYARVVCTNVCATTKGRLYGL